MAFCLHILVIGISRYMFSVVLVKLPIKAKKSGLIMIPNTQTSQNHSAGDAAIKKVRLEEERPHWSPANWKAFQFSHGMFLWHVPTSSLLKVNQKYMDCVNGSDFDPKIAQKLLEFEKTQIAKQKPVDPQIFDINIRSIALNVAEQCNLRCTYCFAGEGDYGKNSLLKKDVALKAIEELAKDKENFHVSFFGGEPLLNFSLIERVVDFCKQQPTNFTYAITTNGTLLQQRHVDFFNANNFKVTISYDGPVAHDHQRGTINQKYSSEKLVKKKLDRFATELKLIQSKLRATLTTKYLEKYVDGFLKQLDDHKGCFEFAFRNAASSGNKLFSVEDAETLNKMLLKVTDYLLDTNQLDKLKSVRNIVSYIPYIHRGSRHLSACGAGISYISVSTSGEYYLCHRFTESEDENVGNFRTGLDYSKLELIRKYRMKAIDPCSSCFMRNLCRGGCFHENKEVNENKFKPNPVFCKMQEGSVVSSIYTYTKLKKTTPNEIQKLL